MVAAVLEKLTIAPPPLRLSAGIAAWQVWNALMKLTSKSVRTSSAGVLVGVLRVYGVIAPPAALTRMSRRPKCSTSCGDRVVRLALVRQVGLDAERAAAERFDLFLRGAGRFVLVARAGVEIDVDDRDVGAGLREPDGACPPDPARGAGDRRDLACQLLAHRRPSSDASSCLASPRVDAVWSFPQRMLRETSPVRMSRTPTVRA